MCYDCIGFWWNWFSFNKMRALNKVALSSKSVYPSYFLFFFLSISLFISLFILCYYVHFSICFMCPRWIVYISNMCICSIFVILLSNCLFYLSCLLFLSVCSHLSVCLLCWHLYVCWRFQFVFLLKYDASCYDTMSNVFFLFLSFTAWHRTAF